MDTDSQLIKSLHRCESKWLLGIIGEPSPAVLWGKRRSIWAVGAATAPRKRGHRRVREFFLCFWLKGQPGLEGRHDERPLEKKKKM